MVQITLYYGPLKNQLSRHRFVELNVKACEMLNEAWIFLSQLRYACAKLLAGCIIINKKEAVIANSIEVYERSRTIDVHRERSSIIKGSPSQSSLPPAQTKYPNTWATVLSTTSHRQPTTNKNKITQLKTKCPQSIIKDNITEIIKLAEENEAPSILNHKAVDKHLCKLAGLLSNSIATQTMVVDQIIQARYVS